jgi:hypothetical protein
VPTVLRIGPYRFHFYSDETGEPAHIHVATGDLECKFWLSPVSLAANRGMPPHMLREVERLVFANLRYLHEKYDEFHHA